MRSIRTRALAVLTAAASAALLVGVGATPAQAAPGATWNGTTPPLTTPWTDQVGPKNALPEYPRPQLARSTWMNLNGLWQYEATDRATFGKDLPDEILVPYPAESALSGVQEHADHMLYRRLVDVPKSYTAGGKHVRMNFGAVNYDATVYVNGQRVARHLGGYDAFSVDITSALAKRGKQEIVVAVASPVDDATIPVGKQRLEPGGIFYTAASGIWQTVWLEPVAPVSLRTLTATPDVDRGTFTFTSATNGTARGARLTVDVYAGSKRVASVTGAAGGSTTVRIAKPRLWSPDDPFLYTFKATLKAQGKTDRVESYAGMRQIAVQQVNGKQRITLNGKPTFLLSTLDQGYWPDGIYTAPTDAGLKFDIAQTKRLGFNTIRKHIKVEPARWYYWADRLGLMVWQDMPSLPTGRNDRLTNTDKSLFRSELHQMVDQLKGVTSIIGWVPFNEGWGQWSVQAAADVADEVQAQDPTRLVDARSGSNCCDTPGDPGNGDVIDWHQYQGPALPAPDADRASMDGEHGGLTLPIEGHSWPGADVNPYGAVKDRAALTQGYVDNTAVLRDQGAPYGLSGSVYTQITDVEGEQNGFFTYDRQVLKPDAAAVRKVNLQTIAAGSKAPITPPKGTPGLGGVGAWAFDEGSGTTVGDSVGSHPLTLSGGTSWVDGRSGKAVQFDGSSGAATSTGPVFGTDGRDYSVAATVKFSKLDGAFQTIVSEDGDRNSAFFLQWSGADRRLAFSFAGARAVATGVDVKPDTWYRVVGVRDIGSSSLTIYVDGKKAGSIGVLGNADVATGPLAVGRGKFGGEPVDFLAGAVDDVRVFDRALSAAEVAQLG